MEKVFSENSIEMVINLVAMPGIRPSLEDPLLYENVNIKGLMNILELCKKYRINVDYAILLTQQLKNQEKL
ncbi:GDP-mannose 4,6-dehydratase [uncultured Ilyobacter sp.]|uniref:GDP-mannose 4,6-dehydratase n=1 Tax=uncultured Ilyobacter sp. TaxID=544433 RepID=UPI0029C91038|nr:GDP-mannose 4,6-dehydratase [uncultured Ilyobacter sp.]